MQIGPGTLNIPATCQWESVGWFHVFLGACPATGDFLRLLY